MSSVGLFSDMRDSVNAAAGSTPKRRPTIPKPHVGDYDVDAASPRVKAAMRAREEFADERERHVLLHLYGLLDGHPCELTCMRTYIQVGPVVDPWVRRGWQFLTYTHREPNAVPDYGEIQLARLEVTVDHPVIAGTVLKLHFHRRDHELRLRKGDADEFLHYVHRAARF